MTLLLRGLLSGAIALLAVSTAAASETSLDGYLESVRAEHDLPALAAAVVKDGEIIAAGAVGQRARGLDEAVTIEDRFHIGSDTKAMTATIAGTLVDEGRIAWDSTVGDVLGATIPDLDPELAAITLEQLLSHTSGIPTDNDEIVAVYYAADALDKNTIEMRLAAIDDWKGHAPVVPEGSPFQYSNFGYLIAGAMLETVAGEPWERLIHEGIFEPLDLDSAGLGPQATFGKYDAAIGHLVDAQGSATPMFWGPAADVPALLGPAGAVHMSILDFARWASWNAAAGTRAPNIVSPETLAEIHRPRVQTPHRENPPPGTPGDGKYALGWGVVEFDWAGKPLLVHNGSNSMNLAKILVDRDIDLGIVVATNYPGEQAERAAAQVQQYLYETYSGTR